MKNFLFIFCFIPLLISAQIQIILHEIPENTPPDSKIYAVGNFNNWQPGDEKYVFQKNKTGIYTIKIQSHLSQIEFKFVRNNSWLTVEGDAEGLDIANRKCDVKDTVVYLKIHTWRDIDGKQIVPEKSSQPNVFIVDSNFFMPQLKRYRRIWIYLPPDYESTEKKFPVLYMHDGQNLFDNATANSGEWQVDETLNALHEEGLEVPIVIGIDNGGTMRINEYSPFTHIDYGGGEGKAYIEFIVLTLKPFIDSIYRTKPERELTSVWGSSLGALISTYAAVQFQEVFSKVGSFSPAYWFSDSIYTYLDTKIIKQQFKIYMLAGGKEGSMVSVIDDAFNMRDALMEKGLKSENIKIEVDPNGEHNELFWRNYFKNAFLWLNE